MKYAIYNIFFKNIKMKYLVNFNLIMIKVKGIKRKYAIKIEDQGVF
jgi:hypothetical protein